jgi:hypothetical protein
MAVELMFGNQSRFTGGSTQATCSVIPNRAIGEGGGLISYGPLMSALGH